MVDVAALLCCVVAVGCSSALDVPFVDEIWGVEYDKDDGLRKFVRGNPPRQWWKQLRDEDGTFSGKLSGYWIRHQDGVVELNVVPAKLPPQPVELELGYHRLPLLGETEEIARQLISFSERRVRLKGRIVREPVDGQAREHGPQGDRGALPVHYVTFLLVTEVVSIE